MVRIYIVMVFHTFDWEEQNVQNQRCSRESCYNVKMNGNVVEQSCSKGVNVSAKFQDIGTEPRATTAYE